VISVSACPARYPDRGNNGTNRDLSAVTTVYTGIMRRLDRRAVVAK
jgi:hypothetical protein